MNQLRQFAVTALAVFVLTAVVAAVVPVQQDAAAIVYITIAVVVPAPVAYFLVYLDGFDRLDPRAERTRPAGDGGGQARSEHSGPRADRGDRGDADAELGE